MTTRRIGYVGLGVCALALILCLANIFGGTNLDFLSVLQDKLIYLGISVAFMFVAFWLILQREHLITGYINLGLAAIYLIIFLISFLAAGDTLTKLNEFTSKMLNITAIMFLISAPFLVKTASNFHKNYKYVSVGLLVLFVIIIVLIQKSYTYTGYYNGNINYEGIIFKVRLVAVLEILCAFIIVANPIIGCVTADGSESVVRRNVPKMVPINAGTNPTMPGVNTIQEGINYGDLPVPDGVVASNNTNSIPEALPDVENKTINEVLTTSNTENTSDVLIDNEVLETNPTEPALVEEVPKIEDNNNQMKSEDVAPELQFLLNGNQEDK